MLLCSANVNVRFYPVFRSVDLAHLKSSVLQTHIKADIKLNCFGGLSIARCRYHLLPLSFLLPLWLLLLLLLLVLLLVLLLLPLLLLMMLYWVLSCDELNYGSATLICICFASSTERQQQQPFFSWTRDKTIDLDVSLVVFIIWSGSHALLFCITLLQYTWETKHTMLYYTME